MVQLSHPYTNTGKTIALYRQLLAIWCLCFLIHCLALSYFPFKEPVSFNLYHFSLPEKMILGTNFIYLGTRREWSGLFWVLCGFSLIDLETHFSLFFPAFFLTSCLYTCYYATPVSPAHAYSTFFSSLILTTLMTQMSAENLELLSFSFLFPAQAVLHGPPL